MSKKLSIYEQLTADGHRIDNHESDLYTPVNSASVKLLKAYEFFCNVKIFKSNIDNELWYDIPFAYDPFWIKANMTFKENVNYRIEK